MATASLDAGRWTCLDPYNTSPGPSCVEAAGTVTLGTDDAIYATAGYAFGTDTRWESRLRLATHLPSTGNFYNYFGATDGVSFPPNPYATDWITFWAEEVGHEAETTNDALSDSIPVPVVTANSFHVYTFDREGTTGVRFFQDGTQMRLANTLARIATANLRVLSWNDGSQPNGHVLDWVRVRKYVTPEPSFTTAAAEGGPSEMRVLSGRYTGNGVAAGRSIFVGFRPDFVIVTADSTNAGVGVSYPSGHTDVLRSSTMIGNVSKAAYVYAHHPLVDRITSLDPAGFTVGHPPNHNATNDDPGDPYHCVNHSGVTYYWTAFRAAPGQMAVGTYTGNGALTQDITTVGFQPDYTIVMPDAGASPVERYSLMPADYSFDFDGGSQCPNPPGGCPRLGGIRTELPNGFRVGTYVNANATTYHYVAWKQTPGRAAIGSYTGTGDGSNCGTGACGDNRNITGLGFFPEHVTISNGTLPVPNTSRAFKPASTGVATDYSAVYVAYTNTYQGQDAIQALQANGFQVGTDSDVNSNGEIHYWAAFGPHTATILYRSVANNGGAALASGGGSNALTISGSTASFGAALANPNIGVGDVIQFNSNGALAFIHGRSSSQVFTVKDKDGNPPTAVAGDTGWFIYRAYRSLNNWESQSENLSIVAGLRDFDAPAGLNLVTADTVIAVACYADANDTAVVQINGRNTDASHYISIFTPYLPGHVGASQRHTGTWVSGGYALVADAAFNGVLDIRDDYVRVTGLRIENIHAEPLGGGDQVIGINSQPNAPFEVQLSRNIIRATGSVALSAHDWRDCGLYQYSDGGVLEAWNNLIYGFGSGIASEYINTTGTYALYNNTVANYTGYGIYFQGAAAGVYRWANNLVQGTGGGGNYRAADLQAPGLDYSSTNLSEDASAPAAVGGGGAPVNGVVAFVGAPDYHLSPGDTSAKDRGTNLSADPVLAVYDDIDGQLRAAPWDIGADDASGTTAVKLMSLEAVAGDAAVELQWRTGSELDNLGFHLYRAVSEGGPWARLTSSLIPGLGSSAIGRAYSFRDGGLVNGTRYFYRLDDVDASSKTTSHGPVSAVPAAATAGSEPEAGGAGAKKRGASSVSCPDWVVAAYVSTSGASASSAALRCTRHGDPEATSLGVVSRDTRQATLELRTGGFYALHEPSGKVRVFVPGFDNPQDPQAPALPVRRALVDAVVGRRAELGRVRALEQVGFRSLVPASLGKAEMQVSTDGTVRAGRRAIRDFSPRRVSLDLARLLPSVFQGEAKSAVVEITPLRYDEGRRQIVLAKRVLVKLRFGGREAGESGRGSFGRRTRPPKPVAGELLARLHTTSRGLHAVSFEQLFPGRAAGLAASQLRLDRQGQAQAFHVAPVSDSFGPGSLLYFHADTTVSSTDFSSETAWELLRAAGGVRMPLVSAPPAAGPVATAATARASFETNRFYQPGLLEAPDPWLWEAVASGATRARSFWLVGVDAAASQSAELEVFLQGASESGNPVDHHVSVSLNGTPVGEAQFAGKTPYRMSLSLPSSVLHDGANELSLTNVADTGVASLVFLDRFAIAYPQVSSLAGGRFDGTWSESGSVRLSVAAAVSGPVRIVDVTGGTAGPAWLTGVETANGALRFRVEAGHRYWVGSDSALFSPRVSPVQPSGLKSAVSQADYLLIAPRAFLAAAEPLLQRRADQGLQARAVAFEEIADEFGRGQPSAEAIQGFLSYAFHSWARPSPRYVLLLGDSSYDPRNFMGTSQPSPLPALWTRTSYLWTVSDPLLAAVNGDDSLPDLAIGRLPAATVEQAQALVEKLIAWEDSGQGLAGQATLVADNPDLAGDFEADVRDITQSFLASRNPQQLLLSQLGAGTRPAIQDALNAGLSYLSYVGHGGAAVWASENVWNSWDAASLQAQSQQPLLVTMNCLNGYFVAPAFDSLAESLLKAEGRGAIASFSPSGLSLDGPAHQYHRALMAELTSGRHDRLGDAILAAQQAYAQSGLMPELLSIYQLLGDPATRIR